MEFKLELIGVPVSDVDRAIEFYRDKVGFNLDHDHKISKELRFVQMTPKGSACSIAFGIGLGSFMKPGSIEGLQLVVKDIEAVKKYFEEKGVEFRGIVDQPWGRFIFFTDPDGNGWAVQQIPPKPAA